MSLRPGSEQMSSLHIAAIARRFVRANWGGGGDIHSRYWTTPHGDGPSRRGAVSVDFTEVRRERVGGIDVTRTPYFYPYWGLSEAARLQLDAVGGNLFSFSLMRALMRVPSLDLIHLHTGKRLGGIGRVVARRRRIPYVITLHGGFYDLPAEELDVMMAPTKGAFEWGKTLGWCVGSRRVLDDAAAIFCIGQKEQREVQARFPGKRVEYLANGADVERFGRGDGMRFRLSKGIPERARLLVTVARIAPQKNQLLVVKALPRLRRRDPSVHVAFVGSVNNQSIARN